MQWTAGQRKQEQISDLEDEVMESNEIEQKKASIVEHKEHKNRLGELSDPIKHSNVLINRSPRRREKRDRKFIWGSNNWKLPYAGIQKKEKELPSKSIKAGQHQDIL